MYTIMVQAHRKTGVTQEEFKRRYEQHMRLIVDLAGDAHPVSHTRWYPQHDGGSDRPILMTGSQERSYSVVVFMQFQDKTGFERFVKVLGTEQAQKKILEDEEGFWEREGMVVVPVDMEQSWAT